MIEQVLAKIWADLLGVERVGVHDNFFDLGGHSLVATQVVSRVRNALEVDLSLRIFFENPTGAGLAEQLIKMMTIDVELLSQEQVDRLLGKGIS